MTRIRPLASTEKLFVGLVIASCICFAFACSRIPDSGAALASLGSGVQFKSSSIFSQAMDVIAKDPASQAAVTKAISMTMPEMYDLVLSKMPDEKTLAVDGFSLGHYRQNLIKNKATVLKVFGGRSLAYFLASRGVNLGRHFTAKDFEAGISAAATNASLNRGLNLTVNCEDLAAGGDAVSIAGAIAGCFCVLPGIDMIACPISGVMLGLAGAGIGITDVAACHSELAKMGDPTATAIGADYNVFQQNPNSTLSSIDPGLADTLQTAWNANHPASPQVPVPAPAPTGTAAGPLSPAQPF